MSRKRSLGVYAGRFVLVIACFVALFPLLWALLNSFKQRVDIITQVPKFVFSPTLENYAYILGRESFYTGLTNSIIVCGLSVIIGVVLGLPAAYAIAKYPNRWTEEIRFFVLSLRFLPPVAVALPLMVIWLDLGLYDTITALVVSYVLITLSCTIWLAVPAFESVPKETEEAATIDGYRPYSIFFKVSLPIAARTLLGAIAFSFVLVWNEFLIALMLTTSDAKTLPIVASEMTQLGLDTPWGVLNASVVLLSLPPLLFLGVLNGLLNRIFKA